MQETVPGSRNGHLAGSARLELTDGVALLHPEDAVMNAMLDDWTKQQRARRLSADTAEDACRIVRRFTEFAGEYPWNWTAAHVDEWSTALQAEYGRARSTIRGYQNALRLFCDYITSPHYQWAAECVSRFGTHPVQVCHEWNTAAHLADYEGDPGRRPLTREELQALFDYADEQVDRAVRLGRKGALAAYRDATVLKSIYAWGLRCREVSLRQVWDLALGRRSPAGRTGRATPQFAASPPSRRLARRPQ